MKKEQYKLLTREKWWLLRTYYKSTSSRYPTIFPKFKE